MYHRIRIPEGDQHVHSFLWRNLQTDRKPDIYVKTVLTFGDKPAPAMAQIALHKTADKAKKDFPEAAQVLKDNTYMDDICNSVRTEEKARELTTCTELNVADDVSRGIPVRSLAERWQHGPKFLHLPENQWPQDSRNNDQPEVEEECRKVNNISAQIKAEHPIFKSSQAGED